MSSENERLRDRDDPPAVRHLDEEPLSLSPTAAAVVADRGETLAALGFEATPFGGSTVTLSTEQASALVERLGQCLQPFACPHGRPTVPSIEEGTLAAGFERGARSLPRLAVRADERVRVVDAPALAISGDAALSRAPPFLDGLAAGGTRCAVR
jgi:hypothetical protein